ncbi:MAG: S-methyl-5-thioribose-1-phosphate isomerase [Halieaceae bacterium]
MNSEPRSLSYVAGTDSVSIIDQTRLPGALVIAELRELEDFCRAITTMQVRGAPLIGITAAYGLALQLRRDPDPAQLQVAAQDLAATRPTAVNLQWAIDRMLRCCLPASEGQRAALALAEAEAIAAEDIAACRAIGEHGLDLLQGLAKASSGEVVNVMTHCNAGRLAALEYGTALAPLYLAREAGLKVHVWVSETRPRNQGASLTAWELQQAGVPYTVIADNAAAALMQAGQVDCCIVGSDRTAANGDVCNKVGTYMKALAARQHQLPFYVALPLSTVDWDCASGADIPIEQRAADEVLTQAVSASDGSISVQRLSVEGATACNPAFDVTPGEFVTALITERGVVQARSDALAALRQGSDA